MSNIIPGFLEYQIDCDKNQVVSLKYGKKRILKNNILKTGHLVVKLSDKRIVKQFGIHQIVMLIKEGPCPEGMEVCHNDGNPANNHPDNLRYDTRSKNMYDKFKHGYKNNFQINNPLKGKCGVEHNKSKRVLQLSKNNELIKEWGSTREAGLLTKNAHQNISACCRGLVKTCGGYIWKYCNS